MGGTWCNSGVSNCPHLSCGLGQVLGPVVDAAQLQVGSEASIPLQSHGWSPDPNPASISMIL